MATACWCFIVAKSTRAQAAPLLDFFALPKTNRKFYQHFIHRRLWTYWGQIRQPPSHQKLPRKRLKSGLLGPEKQNMTTEAYRQQFATFLMVKSEKAD
jgi:hypothetical protein